MRFSLQSLAICLLSAQARFALAGPCRPLTTTSVGAATTTATSKEVSTTATLSEEPTTTIEGETSTVVVSDESTTTTALSEELATTTAAGITTAAGTTTVAETTTAAGTTTIAETTAAAASTTTTSAPEPSFYAQYNDGSEVGVYLQSSHFVGTNEDESVQAEFALETDTSRLYVTLSDGSKLYAYTVIPTGPNYGFLFDTYENIDAYPSTYHFITCTADSELLLTCYSEVGPTQIYFYKPSSTTNFYSNMDSAVASYPGNTAASFRLPRSL